MPIYDYECENEECGVAFEKAMSVSRYDEPQSCPTCGSKARKLVALPRFNLPGDGFPGKNNRVAGQMARKNERLREKETAWKRDAPIATLHPNVDGERTDSWSEAQKLAGSKGKHTGSYEPKIREENSK